MTPTTEASRAGAARRVALAALLGALGALATGQGTARADWLGAPTPLDERRRAALQMIDGRYQIAGENPSYPTPNYELTVSHHEYYYQDKAAAIFGLVDMGEAPESRLEEANRLLRYQMLGAWVITGPSQLAGDPGVFIHRSRSLGMRIYLLYSHLLDPDLLAEYQQRLEWMIRGPFTSSSENIRLTNTSSYFLAHEALGRTGAPTYAEIRTWLASFLRDHGAHGDHEWGGPYNYWTFLAIFNLAEFSSDPQISLLARMYVDYWIARQLVQSIGTSFCSGAVRRYSHWTVDSTIPPQTRMAELFFRPGGMLEKDWGADPVLSNYRPLQAHDALSALTGPYEALSAEATSGGKRWLHYHYQSAGFGVSSHRTVAQNHYVLPSGGTHDIVGVFLQSAKSPRNHVVPFGYDPGGTPAKKRNQDERYFGYQNVVLANMGGLTRAVWAGSATYPGIPARIYFDKDFARSYEGGWLFLNDGTMYVAWAPAVGDPVDDPDSATFSNPAKSGRWARSSQVPPDGGETVVVEVGDAALFGSFQAFRSEILTRNPRPRLANGSLTYTARDGTVLGLGRWFARLDGQDWDPAGHPRMEAPGLQGYTLDVGSGGAVTFDFPGEQLVGNADRVAGNMWFGATAPPDPPTPRAVGFVWGQQGTSVHGWAYDHGTPVAEVGVRVLASPLHDAPAEVGTVYVDKAAPAEQDANIRAFIEANLGVTPPAGQPFVFSEDFAGWLRAALPGAPDGTYTIQLTVRDLQDPANGSRLLRTHPDGVDAFDIVLGGEGPDGGVPGDGGIPTADASPGSGDGGDPAAGGCGCRTASPAPLPLLGWLLLLGLLLRRRR